jgi:hypothetical protein
VRTIPRTRALDRRVKTEAFAGPAERPNISLPVSLVEVGGEEPACLVFEKRIDPSDVSALEVVEDHLVGDRPECLMGALPALDSWLLAEAGSPLVRTGR